MVGDDGVAKTAGICSGIRDGGGEARAAVLMCGNVIQLEYRLQTANYLIENVFIFIRSGRFSTTPAGPNTEAHAREPHWKQTGKQKSSGKKKHQNCAGAIRHSSYHPG